MMQYGATFAESFASVAARTLAGVFVWACWTATAHGQLSEYASSDVSALQAAVKRTIAKVEQAVVAITCRRQGAGTRDEKDDPLAGVVRCGTGVVIGPNGVILTNHHLLGDVQRSQYEVWFPKGVRVPARIRGADPYSDLAILEVSASAIPFVKFGDLEQLHKGQFVLSLGNPYAIVQDGSPSTTWGIISNVRANPMRERQAAGDDRPNETLYRYGSLIEADVSLRLATSGGPLLALDGTLIGLVTSTAVLRGYGVDATYAIPMDAGIRRVIDRLKLGREAEYGFIGIQVDELVPSDADLSAGVRVASVVRGTPAALAGIHTGDRLIRLAGRPIRNPDEFLRDIGLRAPGDAVSLRIQRSDSFLGRNRQSSVELTLSKKYVRSRRRRVVTEPRPDWRGLVVDYATAIPDLLERAALIDPGGCIAVTDVLPASAAWNAGLRKGMFVTLLNGTRIRDPGQFQRLSSRVEGAGTIRVVSADGAHNLIVRHAQ